ncbi:hypothetical protein TPA0907_49500 [Micromonospora humidisoli]|nr:hypothetical protein TPA0907_49500 [Micromonospora sp. AKA109]
MRPRRPAGRDRGSFTAELATGLPALLLLLFAGITAVDAVTTKAACLDAAREAALAASRGEDGTSAGTRIAPEAAVVSIVVDESRVIATVRAPVRALGARLPRLTVEAGTVAAVEPGAPQPGTPQPAPQPSAPELATPQPETPQPDMRQPGVPEPDAPTVDAPMPEASAARGPGADTPEGHS